MCVQIIIICYVLFRTTNIYIFNEYIQLLIVLLMMFGTRCVELHTTDLKASPQMLSRFIAHSGASTYIKQLLTQHHHHLVLPPPPPVKNGEVFRLKLFYVVILNLRVFLEISAMYEYLHVYIPIGCARAQQAAQGCRFTSSIEIVQKHNCV